MGTAKLVEYSAMLWWISVAKSPLCVLGFTLHRMEEPHRPGCYNYTSISQRCTHLDAGLETI